MIMGHTVPHVLNQSYATAYNIYHTSVWLIVVDQGLWNAALIAI